MQSKLAFRKALMDASLFLPPLYVGHSNNLRIRYSNILRQRTILIKTVLVNDLVILRRQIQSLNCV